MVLNGLKEFLNLCINRNILECKWNRMNRHNSCSKVLIETYWNVNIRAFMPALIAAAGINRNILECK